MSRDVAQPNDQKAMWLYGQEPVKVSYYPVNFAGHRFSDSGDDFYLSLDFTRPRNVIKAFCDFMARSPSR